MTWTLTLNGGLVGVGPARRAALGMLQLLPRLLDEVDLGSRYRGRGDEAAVLGPDEREIGLGGVSPVLCGLKLALEAAHPRHALLGHAFLLLDLALVDADLLDGLVQGLLEQGDVLAVLFHLDHHLLDVALLLAQDLHRLCVPALFLVEL